MKIQLVMAHPDDEVIFGWPMLKQVSSILICSNDKNNPERAWCRYRYKALEELGEMLGIPVTSLDYDSEFYKLNARDGSLTRFIEDVMAHVDPHADIIFTHNWWGEYGHMDHIMVHYIMLKYVNQYPITALMSSDMHLSLDWMNFKDRPIIGGPEQRFQRMHNLNLDLYNQCKAIYDKHGVWTWSQDPIEKCKTYML